MPIITACRGTSVVPVCPIAGMVKWFRDSFFEDEMKVDDEKWTLMTD
jgi:hypothetical protein